MIHSQRLTNKNHFVLLNFILNNFSQLQIGCHSLREYLSRSYVEDKIKIKHKTITLWFQRMVASGSQLQITLGISKCQHSFYHHMAFAVTLSLLETQLISVYSFICILFLSPFVNKFEQGSRHPSQFIEHKNAT